MARIFLLSPAHCGGVRARLVLAEDARFDLARRLRSRAGAPLGEVMSFMSGLYFRGKLAYAHTFARPPRRAEGVLVTDVEVDAANPAYREPLEASARSLATRIGGGCEVVLLGSIASNKYTDVLTRVFGDRFLFPADFVGRGDMSRGGLLLRCVAEGRELAYVPVEGAVRHGPRPPRLTPMVP